MSRNRHLRGVGALKLYEDPIDRPRIRSDCQHGDRPCIWISCKYHGLDLNVSEAGTLLLGGRAITEDEVLDLLFRPGVDTCVLDVADRGGTVLENVGDVLGCERERARQIEVEAMRKYQEEWEEEEYDVE